MTMTAEFKVSIVVPVYNAAPFLRRSVEAALSQRETGEVILVEDDSPDDSLEICEQLVAEDARVRLIRHPDGRNHGAAETRNLGIRSATCAYIAFADADNFYLPNRFARDREILESNRDIDGVYNAQGVHYYSESARESFHAAGLGGGEFLSISAPVPPDEFWMVMLGAHPHSKVIGGLGIDAITLRKEVFQRTGYFDPTLRLLQDVHFYIRMAVMARMAAGILDQPVAVRGVHGQMRSTDPETMSEYRRACWTSLKVWFANNVSNPDIKLAFDKAFFRRSSRWNSRTRVRVDFMKMVASHPRLLFETYGFFDLGLPQWFGRNWLTSHGISFKQRLVRRIAPETGKLGRAS